MAISANILLGAFYIKDNIQTKKVLQTPDNQTLKHKTKPHCLKQAFNGAIFWIIMYNR